MMSSSKTRITSTILGVAFAGGAWLGSVAATDQPPSRYGEASSGRVAERFWNAFHGGQYDDLPAVIEDLTRAYTENPRDPDVNRLLGVAHYWVVAEARRQSAPRPGDADHLILADFYLDQARRLQTENQQFLGFVEAFQAGAKLWLAEIHHDEALKQAGERLLDQAMGHYPLFATFTKGALLARLPSSDPRFREAVKYVWGPLSVCTGKAIDPHQPDMAAIRSALVAARNGTGRPCFPSLPHVPHLQEGWALQVGDLLVKEGHGAAARDIYRLAELASAYESWPLRHALQEQIETAEQRAQAFRNRTATEPRIFMEARYECVKCHQR